MNFLLRLNPELQRNLWLELAPWRMAVLALPAVAGLAAMLLLHEEDAIARYGIGLLAIVTVWWGSRSAVDAIPREVGAHTWDVQRSVGYGPLTMVLGKCFGAAGLSWYAGLLLTALLLAAGAAPRLVLGVLACGAFAQLAALSLGLVFHNAGIGFGRFARLLAQGLAVAPLTVLSMYWLPRADWLAPELLPMAPPVYALLLAGAAYQLCGDLRRTRPAWLWPLFCLALALLGAWVAFVVLRAAMTLQNLMFVIPLAQDSAMAAGALLVLLPLTYGAALMPPRRMRRLSAWRSVGKPGFGLWAVPPAVWPVVLLVATVLAWEAGGLPPVLPGRLAGQVDPIAVVSVLLLVLRDVALIVAARMFVSPTLGLGLGVGIVALLWFLIPAGLLAAQQAHLGYDLQWPLLPAIAGPRAQDSLIAAGLQAGIAALVLALCLMRRLAAVPPLFLAPAKRLG